MILTPINVWMVWYVSSKSSSKIVVGLDEYGQESTYPTHWSKDSILFLHYYIEYGEVPEFHIEVNLIFHMWHIHSPSWRHSTFVRRFFFQCRHICQTCARCKWQYGSSLFSISWVTNNVKFNTIFKHNCIHVYNPDFTVIPKCIIAHAWLKCIRELLR